MEDKKLKLAEALKEEYNRLAYMGRLNKQDYDLAIKYLETGEHPRHYNDYDLLYACIEDFDQMYSDYLD